MAPLEPWEKVLVSQEFFDTDHGGMACQECHGGNAQAADRQTAHQGVIKDPTIKDAQAKCGECHEEIVATGTTSLHATLSTFSHVLKQRAGEEMWPEVDKGRQNHCTPCHSSCGQCHVSRPKFAKNGLINGHVFQKRPSMVNQCTACHGSRVGDEFFGDRGYGDLHIAEGGMDCVECHGAAEMHASGEGLTGRYHLAEKPDCTDCHEGLGEGDVKQHKLHVGKLACQVCHSQDYVNCYSCHVGKDSEGKAYFQNQKEVETFKIGKAYEGSGSTEKFIVVRHEPSDPEVFDFYVKDGFPDFDKVPTWKRASPHNIQRRTWRNQNCNHCHGQRSVFLSVKDLLDYEKGANKNVVVADSEVPKARSDVKAAPAPSVNGTLLVTPEELHGMMTKVVVIDARGAAASSRGHIEGAVNFNAVARLRYPPGGENVMTFRAPDEIALMAGSEMGLDGSERVVIYDDGSLAAPLLYVGLKRIGHKNLAILDGGVEGWEEAGYHLVSGDPEAPPAKTFKTDADDSFLASNTEISEALGKDDVIVLDVRSIAQYTGVRKHNMAESFGKIPGTVNLSVRGLWTPEGFIKQAAEMAWLLESRGITKDKTVITTCNTSQQAAGTYFILEYLGYKKAKVHDGSYISWEQMEKSKASGKSEAAPAAQEAPAPKKEAQFGC